MGSPQRSEFGSLSIPGEEGNMKVARKTIFVFGLLVSLILSSCASTQLGSWVEEHDKALIGGLGGAAAGAF